MDAPVEVLDRKVVLMAGEGHGELGPPRRVWLARFDFTDSRYTPQLHVYERYVTEP